MADVEDLIGGNGDDVLKGDGNANVLLGGPGVDLIQGSRWRGRSSAATRAPTRSRAARAATSWTAGSDDDYLFGGFGARLL